MDTSTGENVMQRLFAQVAASKKLSAMLTGSCKFLLHGDTGGVWILQGGITPTLTNNVRQTDCTIECSVATLTDIVSGKENPQTAFLKNDLQVRGDTELALKLVNLWES